MVKFEGWKPDNETYAKLRNSLSIVYCYQILFSDKALLRTLVLEMHEQGLSYREIGRALGLHWTRVHQIVKS
jgi:hypothetical protein